MVPLGIIGFAAFHVVTGVVEERAYDDLRQSGAFARRVLTDRRQDLARLVDSMASADLARDLRSGREALEPVLEDWRFVEDLDVVVVTDSAGGVVASLRRQPDFAPGVTAPTDGEILAGGAGGRVITARAAIPVSGGVLVAGIWLDRVRLDGVFRTEQVGLVAVDNGRVIASTVAVTEVPDRPGSGRFRLHTAGTTWLATTIEVPGVPARLVTVSRSPLESLETALLMFLAALLAVLVLLVVLVGHLVSGVLVRPVNQLVAAAMAVAEGDLDHRVQLKGDVETTALGNAFNRMTEKLRDHVAELENARTEFRQAVARLGDVLTSTDDIQKILEAVLETCALTLRGEAAVFYERVAMPARVRSGGAFGPAPTGVELNGTGVAGSAGLELRPVLFPGGATLAPEEPQVDTAVAVPVIVEGRLFGVLAVYGCKEGGVFGEDQLSTFQTLARQAEVAIGNVMLHEETRRQARTDDLTGLWNRREFELRSREAVKEAVRFDEPFGLMLVDIDDFKYVNDRYSYLHGNAALITLAARLSEATREVDFVARWGGEEFVVLLPRAGLDETALVSERVRAAVASEPVRHDGDVIPLTVSIGYAGFPDDGTSAERLFAAANSALKEAKHLGKNRVRQARANEGVA